MSPTDTDFHSLLSPRLGLVERAMIPHLTTDLARKLIERVDSAPLFAHAYALLSNLTYGTYGPNDVLEFAARHGLTGACLHVLDGEERSLSRMDDQALRDFAARAADLGLEVHLEISTTDAADVDELVRIATLTGVRQLRVYARFEGHLSEVVARIAQDLRRLAEIADEHDLHFSFEQHEELRSNEIRGLLDQAAHPRLHALFDFGNMINACEQPMDALRNLTPHIRQVHLKGVHILPEGDGYGHRGVLQGSSDDDLPNARMLFELLMLGETEPQVIALACEQENLYYAPAFRQRTEAADPFIPYRDLSTTGIPAGWTHDELLAAEPGWADDQVAYVKGLLARLRAVAVAHLAASTALAGAR